MLTISWSQLRLYDECKQKAKLTRDGKRATLSDARVFFPGSVTDRVVRDWLTNTPGDLGRMAEMVPEYVEPVKESIEAEGRIMKWRSAADRDEVIRDCIEAVTKIEPNLMQFVVPFDYMVDFRFRAPLKALDPRGGMQDVLVIGAMDIIVRDRARDGRERYFVFDVKHTRDEGYWRKTRGQLTFYDIAVDLLFGVPTSRVALFQPLCKVPVKPVPIEAETRGKMLQTMNDFVRDVVLDEMPPKQSTAGCNYCEVKHACVRFKPIRDPRGGKRISF